MAFANGGSIVTSGLVLALDASDRNSYSGSGTTWFDLTGNNITGSITGSSTFPTYNSSNNGVLVFNGTNNVVDFRNPSALQITVGSISIWFRGVQAPAVAGGGFNGLITKQLAWGLFMSGSLLVAFDWGASLTRNTNRNIGDNNWYNICMTFTETSGTPSNNAIIYLNGSPVLTTTVRNSSQTVSVQIGNGGMASQFLSGSVANASVYNRVLSASEVLQNYNAQKSRFNL